MYRTFVVDFETGTSDIHRRDCRSLHRHTHADAADLAIAHVTHRIFVFPADHLTHFFYTTVECAACINLIIICWHQIALFNHVFQADLKAIHLNLSASSLTADSIAKSPCVAP